MEQQKYSTAIMRQLQAVFAASIIILLISSYASYYANTKLIETSKLVNHTNDVIFNAESLISTLKDAETGQRGFIITSDDQFLDPYNGAQVKAQKIVANLRRLTIDNPTQQDNLNDAKLFVDQKFAQMRKILDLARRIPQAEKAAFFTANHEEMVKGKKDMDNLRNLVERVKNEENRLLKERENEQELYIKFTPIVVLIAALISIVISILAYFRIKSDLDDRIKKQLEDETKYKETATRIAEMEKVTKKIATGDYSTRSTDTASDELGRISHALNEMSVALERNFDELEKRNWLQSGAVIISSSMRGERFVKSISNKIIDSLATYLNATVGTLYIANGTRNLKLHGGFAESNAPDEIDFGKGLIGQALESGKMIVSDALPADYMKISSSIGNTLPTYAIVLPLIHGEAVIGAIELGLLHKPSEADITFLKDNGEPIAIGINGALSYEKMQDLLEETQAQSEELQSQHNELENINSELEVQTEKLQASEEELRVQQEELQQANQELEERSKILEERNHLILEKNMEVQRKAEELAVSTRYKSEFLANMSHELRTPLNSILLLSRLLVENSETNLNPDQVEYARVIQSSGNGLLSLIDEILDLSKIESGKMQLEYEAVAVKEITGDMRGVFEALAREKKIGLEISVDPGVPVLMDTDKLRLEQILKNLLSNALKFTNVGRVTLSVTRNRSKDELLDFVVTDTGIGIPADKQQVIFEAFQQADGSTRRKYGGTGLGLSISKELARLLGGDITIDSEPGKGSTFIVHIPVKQGYKMEEEGTPAVTSPNQVESVQLEDDSRKFISTNIPESVPDDRASVGKNDKTILIIEDDTSFAQSLLDFTRKKGYKGIVSVRGDEGIELARKFMPVGILLDLQLPIKSGWQVMEELKSDTRTRPIPVHIMSSHSAKRESLMKGAINFIDKPVAFEQMQEIFTKLEHVLNNAAKKVLIVEENPMHAKALAYFLETFQINSDIKTTVPESIEALKTGTDCVILDMGVPDKTAYAMLEEVKKNAGMENIPIIVFTGKSLSLVEEQRIKQYADSIVVKTAHSYQRILDEVSLFLHLVEDTEPRSADNSVKKLAMLNDVLKDKTVLVVDDDVRNIFSLTKALEKMQMNIVTAIDGKEAIEKLNTHKNIDVVLLDMMMPQMDGYETARAIRLNKDWKSLPVIAVTAKAMAGDRHKCIEAGASDYITKPVDIDQLLSLLRVWLYEKA